MELRDFIKKMNDEELGELHQDYTRRIAEEAAKHSIPSPETKRIFEEIKSSIANFCKINSDEHIDMREIIKEVIKHQKHTNGDISEIKLWRAKMEGMWAGASKSVSVVWIVIIFFFGSILPLSFSIYFNNRSFSEIQKQIEAREVNRNVEVGINR